MSTLFTLDALGTKWWIEIFSELDEKKSQTVENSLRLLISEFENNYSRFKDQSKLSILNHQKHLPNPSEEFLEIIKIGKKLYRDTNGVFNILIGEHLESIGYDKDYSFTDKSESFKKPSDPNTSLIIKENEITISDGYIDIGGYGKGYLIDLISKQLIENHEIKYFLINGGGDMYATSDFNEPVTIYLEHPDNSEITIASTTILNEGFAASSTKKRHWRRDRVDYSHIIDTQKEQSLISDSGIYVKAPTAVLADAWATTLLISKPENYLSIISDEKIKLAIFKTESNSFKFYGRF